MDSLSQPADHFIQSCQVGGLFRCQMGCLSSCQTDCLLRCQTDCLANRLSFPACQIYIPQSTALMDSTNRGTEKTRIISAAHHTCDAIKTTPGFLDAYHLYQQRIQLLYLCNRVVAVSIGRIHLYRLNDTLLFI